MLVVKFVLISSIFAFASDFVEGKFMVDDMSAVGNPDYLTISAGIDKSGVEPIANVYADLIKDVNEIKVKVSLSAEVSGEFKEIYKSKDFNPCKDEEVEDDFVKYALDQIEKYGNLKMKCPLKAGHYFVENFMMDEADTKAKSLGNGRFKVVVQAFAVDGGNEVEAMSIKFAFHSE